MSGCSASGASHRKGFVRFVQVCLLFSRRKHGLSNLEATGSLNEINLFSRFDLFCLVGSPLKVVQAPRTGGAGRSWVLPPLSHAHAGGQEKDECGKVSPRCGCPTEGGPPHVKATTS